MFKFQNPNLRSENVPHLQQQLENNKLKLEAGESLNEVSEVDSLHSLSDLDDDEIDIDKERRIRSKVMIKFHFT